MTGPPVSIDSLLSPTVPQAPTNVPIKLDDLLGEQQPSYTPDDEFADAVMKQFHPWSRLIPKEVRVGLGHAGREVVGGAIDFFKKFIYSPPSVEKLRSDLANWDTYQPVLTGAGQEIGASPARQYGSKENLERLIHRSIIARAEGKELTPNDVIMAFVPPYAVANMLYSTASRVLDVPAIALGVQPVPLGSTKLREITTALASGTMQLGLVAGGAHEGAKFAERGLSALRESVISTKVEASQAASHVESVNTFPALAQRIAQGPSPELAGIRERLMGQETANVTSTLINAHRELNPEGVTIIPGVTNPAKALGLARRAGVSSDVATYLRPDGTYDMALYGKESALSLGANRASFQRFGYFEGQESAINGTRVAFMGPAEGGAIKVKVIASGNESYTSLDQLRRVPFNNSSIIPTDTPSGMFTRFRAGVKPITTEQLYTDFTKFRDDISTGKNPAESAMGGLVAFPDVADLQRGPYSQALELAKRYHTKSEIVSEFQRAAQEHELPVSPELAQRIAGYAESVEQHSLYTSPERLVNRFAETRGIHPDDIPAFANYVGTRLGKELRSQHMSAEDLERFDNAQRELSKTLGRPAGALETLGAMEQLPLAQEAATNGYRVSSSPNNAIILSDASGRELGRFHTDASAREFINRSGQTNGPALNPPNIIPDQTGGAAMPPTGGKLPPTYGPEDGLNAAFDSSDKSAFDKGRFGEAIDIFRASFDMAAGREAGFESVDNLFFTKFGEGVRKLMAADGLYKANARAFAEKYLDHIGVMLKGLKKEQFANVFRYIEAKSPGELTTEMLSKGRSEAVEIARAIADLRIDTSRAIEFSRKLESIKKDLAGQSQDAINMEIEKQRAAMSLDMNHVAAAGVFEGLRQRDINTVPIHEIARLADALIWDSPGRNEFAKLAGMSAKELLIAHQFDNLFDQAAKIKGIPDYRLISGYISHFKAQLDKDLPTPEASVLFQKGLGESMEHTFVNEFVRTGELSAIELNPYLVALRYIDSAFKSRDFVPTYRETLKAWDVELNKLKGSATGRWIVKNMKGKVERFVSDLRGHPAPTNEMLRAGIRAVNEHLGTKMDPLLVEKITKRLMQWTSTAYLAFRSYLGLKHLNQFWGFAGVRFGFGHMLEGLKLAEMPGAIDNLRNTGVMSGLSFTSLVTPEEATTSAFVQAGGNAWKAYESFAKVGHAATLLPTIYEHTYAATYLGLRKLALDNLNLLSEGKLGKVAAYDNISLDSFAPSFRAEFDGLVRAGKIDEAAALIAKRGAKETIFDYQQANAPRGWNSVQGRFLTMFGTWSLHATELVNNMLTRGSLRHRVNYAARFAMYQGATYLAGRSIGIDLLGSTVAHSLFWSGSPQYQLLQTTVTAINGQGVEQDLAQNRLFKLVPGLAVKPAGQGEGVDILGKNYEWDLQKFLEDPRSPIIPGSYALGDWMQAIQEHNDPWSRYTTAQQGARLIGVPTVKYKSWVDDYMEQWGLHFYDYKTTVPQQ